MAQEKTYTQMELMSLLTNLENFITDTDPGILKGENGMPRRKQEKVTVNGRVRWISGYSMQDLMDNYVGLLEREGLLNRIRPDEKPVPLFGEYLRTFIQTYKGGQAALTEINRNRIIENHIIPKFGKEKISDITTTNLQDWFNTLAKSYAKETISKIKNIMSPAFDAAVEDNLIPRNPLRSSRIKIEGKEVTHHKAIPKNIMDTLRAGLPQLDERERIMGGLLAYTGMRLEEVLGSRWEDYDSEWIHIERAVIHPHRNKPEIKPPKTFTSRRVIPLPSSLKPLLGQPQKQGYLLFSSSDLTRETPLSYSEARRSYDKIRKKYNLQGFSAHDFRDTCATEWREASMPLDVIARLLGHSKTETTEKRYVKYREDLFNTARQIMNQV